MSQHHPKEQKKHPESHLGLFFGRPNPQLKKNRAFHVKICLYRDAAMRRCTRVYNNRRSRWRGRGVFFGVAFLGKGTFLHFLCGDHSFTDAIRGESKRCHADNHHYLYDGSPRSHGGDHHHLPHEDSSRSRGDDRHTPPQHAPPRQPTWRSRARRHISTDGRCVVIIHPDELGGEARRSGQP